jgi:hypothetical protein
VLGPDATQEAIDAVTDALIRLQDSTRPVVLTFKNNLNRLRGNGWLTESLVDLAGRDLPSEAAETLVEERLDAVIGEFEPSRLMIVGKSMNVVAETMMARHPELELLSVDSPESMVL